MKKSILTLIGVLFLGTAINAMQLVPLSVSNDDDKTLGNGHPKSPIQPPTVYIDDYTLSFVADHPEYVLSIKDEEDEVVYTTVVSSSQTQVILPSTLSSEYKIELIMGNWLFTGWINL